jgi:phosphatidylserine decarboxylase
MSTLSIGERIVRSAWRMAPKRTLSGIIGGRVGCALLRPLRFRLLKSFAKKYEIDVTEAEWPLDQYINLHEFLTSKLRQVARMAS